MEERNVLGRKSHISKVPIIRHAGFGGDHGPGSSEGEQKLKTEVGQGYRIYGEAWQIENHEDPRRLGEQNQRRVERRRVVWALGGFEPAGEGQNQSHLEVDELRPGPGALSQSR